MHETECTKKLGKNKVYLPNLRSTELQHNSLYTYRYHEEKIKCIILRIRTCKNLLQEITNNACEVLLFSLLLLTVYPKCHIPNHVSSISRVDSLISQIFYI